MITPNDLKKIKIENTDFNKIEAEIDEYIKKTHGSYPWEEAIIKGEYSVEVRNTIAKKYKDNGWNFVYHRTSSEHNDKPGLTCFMFSNKKIDDKYTKLFHTI